MTVSSHLAMRLVIASGAFLMTELMSPAAANAEPPQPPQTTQVAASPTVGRHTDMIILTVDKKALQAELKTWPQDPQSSSLLKRFRIAIGKAEGDKQQEGDNRTPEGIYFAQSHIVDEKLPIKYGRKAIPIDFPNPIDRASGKTGHGIWLHGVEHDGRVDEAKVTEGCVAFYNADISSLANWLKGYQGVVVIAKDVNDVNKSEDLQTVEKLTRGWMQAWADRKIDDYVKFYRTDFRFGKMDLAGYADFKRRVFDSYRNMKVSFDNLRVVTHPKYAVAFFNQDFHGDQRFTSIGRKALYWERNDNGGWAIRREVFENRRFEFMTFTDAELALLSAAVPGTVHQEKKTPSL
ncbi:MAG: hypothetical protein FJ146_08955 [Deltaproteobacteria bacterium]|nr:hypothetical protein [Deltaproteobacteria bacterium]